MWQAAHEPGRDCLRSCPGSGHGCPAVGGGGVVVPAQQEPSDQFPVGPWCPCVGSRRGDGEGSSLWMPVLSTPCLSGHLLTSSPSSIVRWQSPSPAKGLEVPVAPPWKAPGTRGAWTREASTPLIGPASISWGPVLGWDEAGSEVETAPFSLLEPTAWHWGGQGAGQRSCSPR